ncbi:MAG: hypothetical protein WCS06_07965 [Dysgonamonadaceae bacterium]
MKQRQLNVLIIAAIAAMAFAVSSCTDDSPTFNETQWEIVNISVPSGDWEWDNVNGFFLPHTIYRK